MRSLQVLWKDVIGPVTDFYMNCKHGKVTKSKKVLPDLLLALLLTFPSVLGS